MNVETFIRSATRGLSRRKRAEAQAELRSHLHERTNQLILLGKPLPSAQAQAMQELGAPSEIARGLRRTEHVHPLLSATALTALAGVLVGFPAVEAWLAWRNDRMMVADTAVPQPNSAPKAWFRFPKRPDTCARAASI